jgi:signal transduction histidine kinase
MKKTMHRQRRSSRLRILFILAVIVPCAALAFISLRSINRERTFMEFRLQRNLDVELVNTVSVLNTELDRIRDELSGSVPADAGSSPQSAFIQWQSQAGLVRVPFLLTADLEIAWPTLSGASTEHERSFLYWNKEFITDQAEIPVYQNIAFLYKDEIADQEEHPAGLGEVARSDKEKEEIAAPPDALKMMKQAPVSVTAGKEPRSRMEEVQAEQKALSQFTKNPQVREQVYDQARAKGQLTASRTVTPSAALPEEEKLPQKAPEESIYISEPRRFSQITQGRRQGLIPRFVDDSLVLLFWKRLPEGGFAGCVLDGDLLKNRLIDLVPNLYTSARILTILDESGRPLIVPDDREARDWRKPFVAREISERLPRWEAAVYLSDPDALASRANLTTVLLWILVFLLFVAILSGGTYVLNTLRSEMLLARQKTTFVANVSHELKTPLTSIRMFAEMLKERRQPDPEKQSKYLSLMVSETERLTRLINNVLDFTRMERGEQKYQKKKLDVGLLSESLVESQRMRLEHEGFAVTFQNDLGEAFVDGDEESLLQTLLNLLSNAEKYSEKTKRIDVDITGTDDSVLIHVKDRGPGVPPREAEKIFKEFYRVDESLTSRVRGSGLGLPIALRIIRDHGGDIRYFPREGGGSVFQVRLPLLRKQPS